MRCRPWCGNITLRCQVNRSYILRAVCCCVCFRQSWSAWQAAVVPEQSMSWFSKANKEPLGVRADKWTYKKHWLTETVATAADLATTWKLFSFCPRFVTIYNTTITEWLVWLMWAPRSQLSAVSDHTVARSLLVYRSVCLSIRLHVHLSQQAKLNEPRQ